MIVEHHEQLVEQNSHLIAENQNLHLQLDQVEARERKLVEDLVSVGRSLSEALERLRQHVTSGS